MMRAFAAWLMQSRTNAILGVVLLRLLGLFSSAVIALTNLVQGPLEGLRVALIAGALLTAGAYALGAPPWVLWLTFGAGWLPAWLSSAVLRYGGSLAAAFAAATGLVIGALLALHAVHPDPVAMWRAVLEQWLVLASAYWGAERMTLTPGQLDAFAQLAGGMFGTLVALGAGLSLLLARWLQSLLVNPGGFAGEFRSFRNGWAMTAAASALFAATLFVDGVLIENVALVVLVPFVLQGVGVVHRVVAQRNLGVGWLVAVYALAALMPLHMWALCAGLGFADNWWNIDAGAPRAGGGKNE